MEWKTLILALSVTTIALSGCIGDDPAPTTTADEEPGDATATEDTGAIEGKVFDTDLIKIAGASVALVAAAEIVQDAQTDDAGRYVFNDIKPGQYKVQVSSICCKAAIETVQVTAGSVQTVDFSLDRLTADDLQEPYHVTEEWTGFVACGVGTLAVSWATCSTLDDPNDDFMLEFNVSKGIKSFVFAMDWDPVGGVSGQEFSILLENDDCDVVDCSYEYAEGDGTGPHIIRIDNDDITDEEFKWDAIEDSRTLQFRVFPSGDATAVYQQPFNVYYHSFYWDEAPEDFNPLPDN